MRFLGLAVLLFFSVRLLAEPRVSISAVGDIVPGTNFLRNALPPGDGNILFKGVKKYFGTGNLVFGNFESTMTNYPKTRKNTKRKLVFAFRTPPSYARVLKNAGFDILSIANNHSFDFYARGFRDTARNLESKGIRTVGRKNEIEFVTHRNLKLAFIGFGYTNRFNSIHRLPQGTFLVKKAKRKADIVVISVHAGAEGSQALHVKDRNEIFYGENRGNLVRFSHQMIRAGADLILGHGPHVPRALELYRGRLIAYSLGNFVGYRVFSLRGPKGLSYILRVKLEEDGRFHSGKIIPLRLNPDGIPLYDPKMRTIRLIKKLSQADFPRTKPLITDEGEIKP